MIATYRSCDSGALHRVAAEPRVACSQREHVYFFLDFSNIAIAASEVAIDHGETLLESRRLRLHAGHLREFVERDRIWEDAYAAAGLGDGYAGMKRWFEQAGIRFDAFERGCKSGREQGIDQIIQGQMRRLLCPGKERGCVVLATGDGKGRKCGEGFLPALEDLHTAGFGIEVMSWKHSFNSDLRAWAAVHGEAIELDAHVRELTFVDGGRAAERVRHKWRRNAC